MDSSDSNKYTKVAERFAFFSIAVNMVAYLVGAMHQPLPEAATHVTNWSGAAYVLTLFGAFVADAYLGRFQTLHPSITRPNHVPLLRPSSHSPRHRRHQALRLFLRADQFDESDPDEAQKKYSFFNWFFFAINMGALFGITLLVYVQVELGWAWGFGIPTCATIISIFILAAGWRKYRYQKPMGSAFTRFVQVIVASGRNHLRGVEVSRDDCRLYEVDSKESDIRGARKLAHTQQYSRRIQIVHTNHPHLGIHHRPRHLLLPALHFLHRSGQHHGPIPRPQFQNPPGSIPVFSSVNALIVVPIYEKIVVPFLRPRTGHPRGITSLQRMGTGLFVSIVAMVSAAVVEKKRRDDGLTSVFWLFPQCFLIGTAEVFTYVGQLEFFYDEATDGTRSISSAVFLSEIGIGSWLSTAIVKIVERFTGGMGKGWLRDDLNKSRLDYFYWVLTGINGINFFVYLWVAGRYKGKKTEPVAVEFRGRNDVNGKAEGNI
ncbi:hypothetical protein DH2020_035015 [Rehmannia glutinosa]|uniref:Uncharacterized protein n=1 Tax=Rehmannia glutinosa TaxID=99300 RepID=A0ABR0V7Q4_REHGL